jgi:hypothetical protein
MHTSRPGIEAGRDVEDRSLSYRRMNGCWLACGGDRDVIVAGQEVPTGSLPFVEVVEEAGALGFCERPSAHELRDRRSDQPFVGRPESA